MTGTGATTAPTGATVPVPGFGAGDCRFPAHLIYSAERPCIPGASDPPAPTEPRNAPPTQGTNTR